MGIYIDKGNGLFRQSRNSPASRAADASGDTFIFIIDEWDAILRECAQDPSLPNQTYDYVGWLRSMFKDVLGMEVSTSSTASSRRVVALPTWCSYRAKTDGAARAIRACS